MRYLLILLALLAPPALAQQDCGTLPSDLTGMAYAIDGSTLAMISEGKRTPDIRLWGVLTPELRERTTDRASNSTSSGRVAVKGSMQPSISSTVMRSSGIDARRFSMR